LVEKGRIDAEQPMDDVLPIVTDVSDMPWHFGSKIMR
jgi:hypothetical protein